MENSSKITK